MEFLIILGIIFLPLIMVLIGIGQFAKAAETIDELIKKNKQK